MGRKSYAQKQKEHFNTLPIENKIKLLENDIFFLRIEIQKKEDEIYKIKSEVNN